LISHVVIDWDSTSRSSKQRANATAAILIHAQDKIVN